MHKLISIFDVV